MTDTTAKNVLAGWLDIESVLAVGSLIVFGAALASVLFYIVPAANEKYVMLMLGALIGVVKDTFGRYFQATKGAQEQRKEFADLALTAATSTVPAASTSPAPVVVTNDPTNPVPTTTEEPRP